MAQADHLQLPDVGGATATEPSPDSAVAPDSTPQPQNSLNAYEQQMAIVTVQTYTELTQISEALHSGRSFGSCIGRMLPFIAGPAQQKWGVHLDAQQCGAVDRANLMIEFPNLNRFAVFLAGYIAVIDRVDSIEDLVICQRAMQLDIF